jgi:hypothetical protein
MTLGATALVWAAAPSSPACGAHRRSPSEQRPNGLPHPIIARTVFSIPSIARTLYPFQSLPDHHPNGLTHFPAGSTFKLKNLIIARPFGPFLAG